MGLKVLLVDDHALFIDGIASLLRAWGMEVVGQASNGKEALAKARELRPQLILMDIYMPDMGGLQATKLIKAEIPEVKIVILTVSDDEQDLFEAIKNGAEGYLLKNMTGEEFGEMVSGIVRGELPMPRKLAGKILTEFQNLSKKAAEIPAPGLSAREKEVLSLVAKGSRNREIAACLFISEETVKYHLRNILNKLHLSNRAQAIAYAVKEGLLEEKKA